MKRGLIKFLAYEEKFPELKKREEALERKYPEIADRDDAPPGLQAELDRFNEAADRMGKLPMEASVKYEQDRNFQEAMRKMGGK